MLEWNRGVKLRLGCLKGQKKIKKLINLKKIKFRRNKTFQLQEKNNKIAKPMMIQ